ncbi:MAG: helix-turn-helix transcriptional regulator [Phascolarctobacterium sp.]|nr:helix-turn-helix transcriptional regulator [Phascolarctobacterium sp.]
MEWKNKIKILMDQNGLNQKELSKISGIAESSLSRYLNSDQRPRIDIILNLAKALNVSPEYILSDEENNEEENAFIVISTAIARKGNSLTPDEKNKLIALLLGKV